MAVYTVPARFDLRGARSDLKTFESLAKASGQKTGSELLKAMQAEFNRQRGNIQEAQRRGLITPQEARKLGNDVGRAFNEQIVQRLDQMRRSGQQNTAEFTKLQRSLKSVGTTGSQAFRQVEGDAKRAGITFGQLRATIAAVVAFLGVRRGLDFLRGTIADAENLTKSYLQLGSAAKLFNVDQQSLIDLAARARTEYKLNAGAANELAVNITKLTARANQAARSQEVLAAALDLGAAQGLSAAQVGVALEQTLRGLDEGTDKLFQRNPSQIYEDYARAMDRTGASLSDVEQKQALVNAVLTEGAKVQGSYDQILATSVGKLTVWRQTVQEAREEIGSRMIPVVVRLQTAMAGPLSSAVSGVTRLLELFIDPLDRVLLRMEQLGQASETALPLILQDRINQAEDRAVSLERQLQKLALAFNLTERADRARAFGPSALPGGAAGLARAQADAVRDLNAALAAGDVQEAERMQRRLAIIQEALSVEREIATVRRDAESARGGLGEARRKAELASQLDSVKAEIEALAATMAVEGESAATNIALARLQVRREQLEKELGRIAKVIADAPAATAAAGGVLSQKDITAQLRRLEAEFEATSQRVVDLFTLETAPQIVAAIADIPTKLAPAFRDIAELLAPVGTQMSVLRENVIAVAQAEAELSAARIAGDPAGTAAADERLVRTKERLADVTGDIARLLRESGVSGEVYRAAVEELEKALKAAGVETEKVTKDLATFDDHASAVTTLARGALALADNMGDVSDETRRAVTGVLDLVQGLQQVKAASGLGGLAGALGTLSGVGAIAGGLVGIGSALFGGNREAEKQQREAAVRLARDLEDLHQQFRNLADSLGPLGQAIDRLNDMIRAAADTLGVSANDPASLGAERQRLLTTAADFRKRAEDAPDFIARMFIRLAETMEEQAAQLDQFAEDYAAALEEIGRTFREDLDNREAAAKGYAFDLARREQAARHEAEIRDAQAAILAGALNDEDLARLKYIQSLEKEKQALAEATAARDFAIRTLELQAEDSGTLEDAIAAARARAAAAVEDELATAKKLLDQGVITQEMFDALAAVLANDVEDAIQGVIDSFKEMGDAFREGLELGELELGGDEGALGRRRLELQRDREIKEAQDLLARNAITQEDFDRFLRLWDGRIEKFVADLEGIPGLDEAASGDLTRDERLAGTTTTRSLQALTEATGFRIEDLLRTQMLDSRRYLGSIDATLKAMAAAGGVNIGALVPTRPQLTTEGAGAAPLSIESLAVNVSVPAGSDGDSIGRTAGLAFVRQVDRYIGGETQRKRRFSGSLKRTG